MIIRDEDGRRHLTQVMLEPLVGPKNTLGVYNWHVAQGVDHVRIVALDSAQGVDRVRIVALGVPLVKKGLN